MPPVTSYHHRAFGLDIASALALAPYFVQVRDEPGGEPDLRVEVGPSSPHTADSLDLEWPGLVRLHVQGGRRLWVEDIGGVGARGLAEMVCGPGIALALSQRGWFVLHGSACEVGGRLVAVCGHSGAGKSTMAAMFAAAGARAFADDIVPLMVEHASVVGVAGPTLAKLGPVPREATPFLREVGPEAIGAKTLCAWRHAAAPGDRAGLAAVFVLEDAEVVDLTPLRGQEAVRELLRHSFCLTTAGVRRQAGQLQAAVAVAAAVPVIRLARVRTIAGAAEAVVAVRAALGVP
jgi:hypothetical protein